MTKKELVKRCIKFIVKDIDIMSKECSFLKNLLTQMKIYHGLCLHEDNDSQGHNIQRVMNFIAQHRVVSIAYLMQELLMYMSESELDMIIKALISAKFIHLEDALIRFREKEI